MRSEARIIAAAAASQGRRDLGHDSTAQGFAEYNHQDEVARFLAGLDS